MTKKIIVVLGPTAVGKTALGIDLARKYGGEIISGDSQQVYCKLDIGTAKASAQEQAQVLHHLIDVRDVTETYSVFDFVKEAGAAIQLISSRGKVPIIVGGTGLYLQSLLEGYHLGGPVDQQAVLAYRQQLDKLSDAALADQLARRELEVSPFNRRRVIRALELNQFATKLENHPIAYEALLIGLNDERQALYQRINDRVDIMMASGLLEEARWLYDYYPHVQATRGIGYKELFPYFAGDVSLDEAVEKIKQNTRHFAKRQLTWFRNRMTPDFYQITDPGYREKIDKAVSRFLKEEESSTG